MVEGIAEVRGVGDHAIDIDLARLQRLTAREFSLLQALLDQAGVDALHEVMKRPALGAASAGTRSRAAAICGSLIGPLLVAYPSLAPRMRLWSRDRKPSPYGSPTPMASST